MDTQIQPTTDKLVSDKVLLEALFDEAQRPSVRWLSRMVRARVIPSYKLGYFRFYSIPEVRAVLEKSCKVEAR